MERASQDQMKLQGLEGEGDLLFKVTQAPNKHNTRLTVMF